MDGVEVSALRVKENKKPVMNIPNNAVILKHNSRDLSPNAKSLYIYFKTRREFEAFYYASIRASKLSNKKVQKILLNIEFSMNFLLKVLISSKILK